MQLEMSFAEKATAVAKYEPKAIKQDGKKIWFTYVNATGAVVPAFYDFATRSFKSVVHGKQYGEDGVAIRNLVAKPVVEGILGGWVIGLAHPFTLGNSGLCYVENAENFKVN